MYLYFSSDYPAIIKLNGIYYGRIDQTPKSLNFAEGEPPFVEVCPLTPLEKQVNLILDNEFFCTPPTCLSVTDMRGGFFIKFNPSFNTQNFSVIAQEKFADAVVTVFCENGYKISIETPFDFFAQTLELKVDSAEIYRKVINGEPLIFIKLIGNKTVATCYKTTPKIEPIFFRAVEQVEFEQDLKTIETIKDMAKHKINATWEYSNGKFTVKEKKLEKSTEFNKDLLNERLIPYAFLEEVLAGGKVIEYLDGTVKENIDRLSEFLGDFIGIMPPPAFRNIEDVGLIYQTLQNKYYVDYFKFTVKEQKIINITKN